MPRQSSAFFTCIIYKEVEQNDPREVHVWYLCLYGTVFELVMIPEFVSMGEIWNRYITV